MAGNVDERVATLQTASSSNLQLVHTIHASNMLWAEQYLHGVYEQYRVQGEWFDLPKHAVGSICAIGSMSPENEDALRAVLGLPMVDYANIINESTEAN